MLTLIWPQKAEEEELLDLFYNMNNLKESNHKNGENKVFPVLN
jgi:hypothetical protein